MEKSENLDNIIDFKKAGEAVRRVKPAKPKSPPTNKTEFSSLENAAKIKEFDRQLKELKEKIAEFGKRRDEVDINYTLAVQSKDSEKRKDIKALFDQLANLNYNITRLKGHVFDIERDLRESKERN